MTAAIEIAGRRIGPGEPTYVIAELSANHGGRIETALETVRQAARCGADAIKIQTYTADTLTIDSDAEPFRISSGSIWDGRTLYDLYREAYTPWEWQPRLKKAAEEEGITLFSTPFDDSAIDFLEELGVPAYKIASFEIGDLALLRRIAATGKPIIMSTGMALLDEIAEAVRTLREAGAEELALLKCTSAYPAPPNEMNLRTIPHLARAFDVPAGLSDHTVDNASALASVALGGCIIEKHFILSREMGGPDASFSLEPDELTRLVRDVRTAEQALGSVNYEITDRERSSRVFRRSLFVVRDMKKGEAFTRANVRSIRPAHGLPPRDLPIVIGKKAARDISRGTPLDWSLIG